MSATRRRPERPLWLTYDTNADAAYVYLTERIGAGGVGRTVTVDPVEVRGMVNLDLDHEDRLIGVEVLDARSRLRADLLASAVVRTTPQDLVMRLCVAADVPFLRFRRDTVLVGRDDLAGLLPGLAQAGAAVRRIEGFEVGPAGIRPRPGLAVDAEGGTGASGAARTVAGWPDGTWVAVALRMPGE